MSVRIKENVIVNTAIVTRRMIIQLIKFSAMMAVIGRADETKVLMMSAINRILLSCIVPFDASQHCDPQYPSIVATLVHQCEKYSRLIQSFIKPSHDAVIKVGKRSKEQP